LIRVPAKNGIHMSAIYRLEFYVPESHLESVKQALFAVGAGKVGNYDCCAWQTEGQGQYRPLPSSQAFVGEVHRLETVKEFKVEMVCEKACLKQALATLKQTHPYEEVAFAILAIQSAEF
jgi:hypothetical protein